MGVGCLHEKLEMNFERARGLIEGGHTIDYPIYLKMRYKNIEKKRIGLKKLIQYNSI